MKAREEELKEKLLSKAKKRRGYSQEDMKQGYSKSISISIGNNTERNMNNSEETERIESPDISIKQRGKKGKRKHRRPKGKKNMKYSVSAKELALNAKVTELLNYGGGEQSPKYRLLNKETSPNNSRNEKILFRGLCHPPLDSLERTGYKPVYVFGTHHIIQGNGNKEEEIICEPNAILNKLPKHMQNLPFTKSPRRYIYIYIYI